MNERFSVMVVDDEPFYLDVLENLLDNEYDVIRIDSSQAALKRAGLAPQPDLILLDVILPELDGYEVCKRLKADPATKDIPIIFLTMKTDVDDEICGFNLGGVDYITKPMSPPIVAARVRTHIKLANTCKELQALVKKIQS